MMKIEFQTGLVEAAAVPPLPSDPINDLLCAVREYSAPIEYAATTEKALELIRKCLSLYRVILISSASLGRLIIPEILTNNLHVQSYYIFCTNVLKNREWFLQYLDDDLDIQTFDHQTVLLIRLCRDMSKILIDDGKAHLKAKRFQSPLQYFEFALALADKAVMYDKSIDQSDIYRPLTEYRRVLDSLIREAREGMKHGSID